MDEKTARALDEMRRAIAKSQGLKESEVQMTVNCRTEEVPDYFYYMEENRTLQREKTLSILDINSNEKFEIYKENDCVILTVEKFRQTEIVILSPESFKAFAAFINNFQKEIDAD